MILAALLLAAPPVTAVEAERAFSNRAQIDGLWTAFRATAAPNAAMFVPQHVNAQTWLKDRKDPLLTYVWWPAEAFVSCDGQTAATTGPSVQGAYRGYFTTLWARQSDGSWKWLLDHGDRLTAPRPAGEKARVRRASCNRLNGPAQWTETTMDVGDATRIGGGGQHSKGVSADGSLKWAWQTREDGGRRFEVWLWNGARHEPVLTNEVAGNAR